MTIANGSSPRMRGKRQNAVGDLDDFRIIPAHAGQTRIRQCSTRTDPDHPRACGANNDFLVQLGAMVGSSPRMRGKPMQTADKVDEHRIIPAHAGQTARPCTSSADLTDHPRACGANVIPKAYEDLLFGSSPRMRGKRFHDLRVQVLFRIIPAHAGQTRPTTATPPKATDHPRACGANRFACRSGHRVGGSSPRMRGKHSCGCTPVALSRIIPAHAGQTTTDGIR